jgi:hypothetical protein
MATPGFSAEASIYRSTQHYATSFGFAADGSALRLQPQLTNGGGNGGPKCKPHCGPCGTDSSSSTGCSKTCVGPDCSTGSAPCTGCKGGCTGCSLNQGCCDGKCTDLQSDTNHCGDCSTVCAPGQVCSGGVCCPDGQTYCGGSCTNTQTNPIHCGSCWHGCNGGSCINGQCANCPPGYGLCGGTCVDLQNDANNCGSCGNVCNQGVGCNGGLCHCPGPQYWTNVSDQCCNQSYPYTPVRCITADLHGVPSGADSIDTCYCTLGPPGTPVANETPYLCTQTRILGILTNVQGHWQVPDSTCCTNLGLAVCGNTCANLVTDPQNCGSCGVACTAPVNGNAACVGGTCGYQCDWGYVGCSYLSGGNTGTRMIACCPPPPANATVQCGYGACHWACNAGYTQCNEACVDTHTDPRNCGSCNAACPSGVCRNGVCAPVVTCSGAPAKNAQMYTYFVESRPSMCQVGSFGYWANSQSEAQNCAEKQWPSSSFAIGPAPVQTYTFAVDCGQGCTAWSVASLSVSDARSCVANQNVGNCTITEGPCP